MHYLCLGLAGTGGMEARGYLCIPHEKESGLLLENWKKNDNIVDIYFVTATFSEESTPYFPNKANHYILASFTDVIGIVDDIKNHKMDRLSLMFISLYFTKYTNGDGEISELANAIARREKVKRASLAHMKLLASEQPKFTFPYSKNLLILEVEGKKTHQTDQKYCERTKRDVARMGVSLNNLVSFSILEKLK
jgi:hypothetical protein